MLPNELLQLVQEIQEQRCEKQHIELKKAPTGTPTKLYATLSSFSNQRGGGIIIFGIEETSDYTICGVYDAQDLQQKVTEQSLQMKPIVRPLFTVVRIEDKIVVSAEISECHITDKPCFYTGSGRIRGSYIRVGDSDQHMTEYEIYSYEAYKKRIHDELRTCERASTASFHRDRVSEYLIALRRQKPHLMNLDDTRILETQGVCQNGLPTLAGLMLLGEYPQEFYPQLSITAMVVPGIHMGELGNEGERFSDNQRIEGTLTQMLEGTMAFVRRNMQVKTVITENGDRADKPEYPLKAVREIILNALIHNLWKAIHKRCYAKFIVMESRAA